MIKKDKLGGYTLLEIIIVIAILAIAGIVFVSRIGTFQYWKEETTIRKLSETITFLHHQAVNDGVFYRLEFRMDKVRPYYRVGEIVAEEVDLSEYEDLSSSEAQTSQISLELAMFLNPSLGTYQNMIPPRSFPSLAKPVYLPERMTFEDIKTPRGIEKGETEENPYIMFSPRGFSEFGVIHLKLDREEESYITILINPFTGLTEIYREYKEFEWTYDKK